MEPTSPTWIPNLDIMRPTTIKRYRLIRRAAGELYGTMPVMRIYAHLAEQFGYTDEAIRKILAKKPP